MTKTAKTAILGVLYFNQGLPYGFFLLTLPVLMRAQGMSATQIGALTFLAMPWTLKVLWAPWVDRYYAPSFGRRRSWIVPLQILLPLTLAGLAFTLNPWILAGGVLFINFLIATQDIAVDGLAVEILSVEERGGGNALQAGAYKIGMLIGGGLLPAILLGADPAAGWRGTLIGLAALTLPALLISLFMKEPPVLVEPGPGPSHRAVFRRLLQIPNAVWFALFVVFAKFGDNLGTSMFRVLLVDRGWAADRIAWVVGTWGLVVSILGSFLMIIPIRRFSRLQAYALAAALQAVFMILVGLAASGVIAENYWTAILVAEHFVSGMITTVLFTLLMDFTPKDWAGSGYTALAVLMTAGMGLGSLSGGISVDTLGFAPTFFMAGLLTLFPIFFLAKALPVSGRSLRDPVL